MDVTRKVARIPTDLLSDLSMEAGLTDYTSTHADYTCFKPVLAPRTAPRRRSLQRHRPGPSVRRRDSTERRVALFTGNYKCVADGVARTLQRQVDFLRSIGYRILIVGPSRSGSPSKNAEPLYVEVPSISMPGRPEYRLSIGLPKSVCRRLSDFNPDLIHIATPDLLGIGALKWAESRRLPVVSTYHTHFPSYLGFYRLERLMKPVEAYFRWFYSRCRHVYVPTPPLTDYFESLGLQENIRLWGRGVDYIRFHPRHRSESWRTRHSIGPDEILVAYVGRLVKEKGMDVIASVFRRLHVLSPTVRSVIVGNGPMRSHLEACLPDTVFTGHLDSAALATAYASSDVFLFPSPSEAFGNVIVEAMASGLPVVCADASCSSSHVVDNVSGLLAGPGDADHFLRQVLRLIRNEEERLMMGFRARRRAESYDWPQTLQQLTDYYREVTSPA